MIGKGCAQPGEEIDAVQLARADVEGQPAVDARRAAIRPSIEATSAITQSPISAMIPVCSAIGMKVPGRRMPSRGWFQRSSASAPVTSPVARLSCGCRASSELAALDRFAQRRFDVDPALVLRGQFLGEQAILAAAALLGAVHGDVGGAHQRFDRACHDRG